MGEFKKRYIHEQQLGFHDVLRSVSGTYTTACTGSSEFISFIGQANNGVACLSYVESGAPRMRIDIQKAEHETSFLFRK